MAEENNQRIQAPAKESVDRREFFVRVGLGSMAMAAAGTAVFGYQFLSPNVLYEPSPIVNMGKPESYQPDSVTLDVDARIFVIHAQEGFFVLNAVCTHLGCLTAWKPDRQCQDRPSVELKPGKLPETGFPAARPWAGPEWDR